MNVTLNRTDRIGRLSAAGSSNFGEDIREAEEFTVRQQGCFCGEICKWGCNPDSSFKSLTASRTIVEGRSGGKATAGVSGRRSGQREAQDHLILRKVMSLFVGEWLKKRMAAGVMYPSAAA